MPGISLTLVWFILFVIFVAAEIVTAGALVSIWFCFGALAAMTTLDEYEQLKKDIGLDENSRVLLFSTEGDTDPDRYKNIVWKGLDK